MAHYSLANLFLARQMFAEALPFAEKAYSRAPWLPYIKGGCAGVLIRTGARDRGSELVQKLGSGAAYGTPLGLAIFHMCTGELDLAAD